MDPCVMFGETFWALQQESTALKEMEKEKETA
jgi:hypothetical protein